MLGFGPGDGGFESSQEYISSHSVVWQSPRTFNPGTRVQIPMGVLNNNRKKMNKYQRFGKAMFLFGMKLPFRSFEKMEEFMKFEYSDEGKRAIKLIKRLKPLLDKLK